MTSSHFNQNTTSFEELTNSWNDGDNVYGSGCQLVEVTPRKIFELSFANKDQFLEAVIPGDTNAECPQFVTNPWAEQSIENHAEFVAIKQRTLTVKTSSFSQLFSKKSIPSKFTQTAFIGADSLSIYSVSRVAARSKEHHHTLINRWTIALVDESKVAISINVNILWSEKQPSPTIKSKWLKFYQSHFESWRRWMQIQIKKDRDDAEKKELMAPYIGIWNKLNSPHSIRITFDQIEYSDGSQFNVSVDTETNQIVAKYARTEYAGRLIKHDQFEEIKWNNGSVWIRNGFERFAGTYTVNEGRSVIHKFGTIKLPQKEKKVRFKMSAPDRIQYAVEEQCSEFRAGTLLNDGSGIQWDDGILWRRDGHKPEAVAPTAPSQSSEPAAGQSGYDDSAVIEEEPTEPVVERMEEMVDTVASDGVSMVNDSEPQQETIQNAGEQDEDEQELDSDFEHNFNHYFDRKEAALQIEKEDHFVVVDDDEVFGSKTLNKVDPDHVDEWLII